MLLWLQPCADSPAVLWAHQLRQRRPQADVDDDQGADDARGVAGRTLGGADITECGFCDSDSVTLDIPGGV